MKKSNKLWSATIWYCGKCNKFMESYVDKTKEYKTYNGLLRHISKKYSGVWVYIKVDVRDIRECGNK